MLSDNKALPPPVDIMRRLLVPVGKYSTAQLPQRKGLLKRVFFASPAQLIRAPDDAPSTQPGRSTIDAANDVAAEFLRDCESAQNLGDVGDDDLAEMLLARNGNNHKVRHACANTVLNRSHAARAAAGCGSDASVNGDFAD
jgi:hypothetical protein